ncbi:MAG: DUF2817 domain-containing protein, partial [Bdellovibrionota bacterium]
VFPGTAVDYGSSKDFYEIHGGLVEYFYHTMQAIPKRTGIVLEFGTLNSQTTLGSLDSVYRMSRENQGFHFGFTNETSKKENQELFREMFYPSDMGWRKKALDDGKARLNDVLKNF